MARSVTVVRTIARRELGAFFGQPGAWVFLSAFLVVSATLGLRGFFERDVADLRDYVFGLRLAFVLLAPAAAMRLWAEERRSGTIELLFTLPVRPWEAVLGKYLAGLVVMALALALGAVLPLSLAPFAAFDAGQVASGYLGAFALAGTFLAVGLLASALSPSQEVAFIAGALGCVLLNLLGDPLLLDAASAAVGEGGASFVAGVAAFAVGPHHEALSRGVLEVRGLIYFFALTASVLFWTVLALERRGRPSNEPLTALLLSGLALALTVGLSNHQRLNARFDLTRGQLNSLSPDTRAVLDRVSGELTVRVYLSKEWIPQSAQPLVRELLDLLGELEANGEGRVRLEVVDPRTPELQAAAERQGVKRFDLQVARDEGVDLRSVYAGVVVFYEGRPPATIPVALGRPNLEYDLALALRQVVLPRKRVGLAGTGGGYPQAAAALGRVHFVDELDLSRAKQVPDDVSTVIYAAPTPPLEREVYVLDQFVARGGTLILLAEGHRMAGKGWIAEPQVGGPLADALEAWGLRLGPGLLLQQAWRRWPLLVDGNQVLVPYPWFIGPTGQGNKDSPVAAGLGQLVFPFASEVSGPITLLQTPQAWVLDGEQDLSPRRLIALQSIDARPRSVVVAARGKLRSAWADRPSPVLLPAAGGGEDPLQIPSSEPTAEGCVVLVGDADFLRPKWIEHGDGIGLLLNLVDWAQDRGTLAGIRARAARIPLSGKESTILGLSRDTFVWALNVLLLPLLVLTLGLGRLGWLRRRRGEAATQLREALARRGGSP